MQPIDWFSKMTPACRVTVISIRFITQVSNRLGFQICAEAWVDGGKTAVYLFSFSLPI